MAIIPSVKNQDFTDERRVGNYELKKPTLTEEMIRMTFLKNHKRKIKYIAAVILVFIIAVCFSPYMFIWVNSKLNTWFPNLVIMQSDYLSYISAVSTGIVAIAISILALIISNKAEHREQNQLQVIINTSKKELKDYIIFVCGAFYEVSKGQKSIQDLDFKRDTTHTLEVLRINGVINESELAMCTEMQSFVNQAFDKTRSEADAVLSTRFCQKYIDMGAPNLSYNQDVMNLLQKISPKGDNSNDQET